MMKLRDYFQYSGTAKEEYPIYLFDNEFGEREPEMLKDYEVRLFCSSQAIKNAYKRLIL